MTRGVDFIGNVPSFWPEGADHGRSGKLLFLPKWAALVKSATRIYIVRYMRTVREPMTNDSLSAKRNHRYLYYPYESDLVERVYISFSFV